MAKAEMIRFMEMLLDDFMGGFRRASPSLD
jgi:hypothetical protein